MPRKAGTSRNFVTPIPSHERKESVRTVIYDWLLKFPNSTVREIHEGSRVPFSTVTSTMSRGKDVLFTGINVSGHGGRYRRVEWKIKEGADRPDDPDNKGYRPKRKPHQNIVIDNNFKDPHYFRPKVKGKTYDQRITRLTQNGYDTMTAKAAVDKADEFVAKMKVEKKLEEGA